MASIVPTMSGPDNMGVITITWEAISNTNQDGVAVRVPSHMDKTVTFTGTFGGTIALQGSNDGTNYMTLSDHAGTDITATAVGIALVAENPLFVKPIQTVATLTDVDCILVCAPRNR